MNQLVTSDGGAGVPATNGAMNAFEQFGQSTESTIKGDLLKFSKGDWTYGQNDMEVPSKYEFVAHVDTLTIGWQRWEDGKPTDARMGLVGEGFVPPPRKELGDTDESEWEVDSRGVPQDPWSNCAMMFLTNRDGSSEFTFTTASHGGRQWCAGLAKEYGKNMRMGKLGNPVIRVGSDSYKHSEFGKIFKPTFEVIGWVPVEAGAGADDDDGDEVPF